MNMVRLGDACIEDKVIVDGKTSKLPYLGLEMIESQTGKIDWLANTVAGISTCFAFNPRHILYSKLRPYLNKVALPDIEGRCTTEIIPLLPKEGVCREYIAYLLRGQQTVDYVTPENSGTRMPRADMKHLFNMRIPLPPLSEQRRIAAEIERQLAAVEKARRAAAEQMDAAQGLNRVYLNEALMNSSCDTVCLNELLVDISYGLTASAVFDAIDNKLLRISDLTENGVNWDSVPGFKHVGDTTKYLLSTGDIVIARTGGTIGKSFLITQSPLNAVFASYLIRLRLNTDRIMPEYAQLFLRSDDYWTQMRSMAQGSGQPNVNTVSLKKLRIPLPTLSEQLRIVEWAKSKLEKSDRATTALQAQYNIITAMPAAILRKAFSGQL